MRHQVQFVQEARLFSVAVLRWGQGTQAPQILPSPPKKFLDTVVLLLVELIGSIVNFA